MPVPLSHTETVRGGGGVHHCSERRTLINKEITGFNSQCVIQGNNLLPLSTYSMPVPLSHTETVSGVGVYH